MRGGVLASSSSLVAGPAGREQVAVDALEVAVDALGADDRLDAVDRRGVAAAASRAPSGAVQALELDVAVVERADRCAVVRPVSPPPIGPSSSTTTGAPGARW